MPPMRNILIAASHYDQIQDISRDQGRTEKAIAALEEVIRKYPTSEYAVSTRPSWKARATSSRAAKCRSAVII